MLNKLLLSLLCLFLYGSAYATDTSSLTLSKTFIDTPNKELFSFGVFTDVHYDKDSALGAYANSLDKVTDIVSWANDQGLNFIIGLGDNVDGNIDDANDIINLQNLDAVLDNFNGDAYLVIGNHDIQKMTAAQNVSTSNHIPSEYYTFTKSGYKFIVLYPDAELVTTTIDDSDGITAEDTTVTVVSTSSFTDPKYFAIENELISYTGKTDTTFTGCTRGVGGTTAATHSNGSTVYDNFTKLSQTQLDWLTTEVATEEPKIVFIHMKIYEDFPSTYTWTASQYEYFGIIENSSAIRTILEGGVKVLAVFNGHIHETHFITVNGIKYYAMNYVKDTGDADYTSYGKVTLYGTGSTVIKIEGYGHQDSYFNP